MPEYEKAFELRQLAQSRLGVNLVFSGTGPFLTTAFMGDSLKDLEELCTALDANIFYANLLNGMDE
jgi:hypothetical protein